MPYNYPIKFGKYLLTKRIAVGGMAELFLAKMKGIKGFEKTLALKKILPEFGEDEEFVELFVDEAKITVQLQHANIVQVFDFGEIDGSYYMAMEMVDGPNLKNLLKRCLKKKGYFPMEIAIYIVIQVLKALDYAQRVQVGEKTLNLVHRDVSPQNILLSREGEVKITDFGIAKAAIKLSKTQPGKIQGKFSYMSPEQAMGLTIDHRSDIFSLGIIFFEMLTGFKLYTGDDTTTKYARVREAKIPPPSNYNKNISRELETIVLKMLAKNPRDRYQTAAEALKELTDYLYPSSTELIGVSLSKLITELFPVPISREEDIKVGKILEVEKDSSTQTDLRLLSKEPRKKRGEPLLVNGKKHITRVSINAEKLKRRRNFIKFAALFIFVFLVIFTVLKLFQEPPKRTTYNTPITTPSAGYTPFEAPGAGEGVETPTPTPTETPTPEPTPTPSPTPTPKAKSKPRSKKRPAVIRPPKPRPCPVDMALIEKGPFLMGSKKDDPDRNFGEINQKLVHLEPYCIDLYEYPNSLGVFPKTDVSYSEAKELCRARAKRLCSETEWEKACKGKNSLKYPYGDTFNPQKCNTQDSLDRKRSPKQIGSFDECKSSGVFDMSGNVAEWVVSATGGESVEKGGSSKSPGWAVRCAARRFLPSDMKNPYLGFRCCKNENTGD